MPFRVSVSVSVDMVFQVRAEEVVRSFSEKILDNEDVFESH